MRGPEQGVTWFKPHIPRKPGEELAELVRRRPSGVAARGDDYLQVSVRASDGGCVSMIEVHRGEPAYTPERRVAVAPEISAEVTPDADRDARLFDASGLRVAPSADPVGVNRGGGRRGEVVNFSRQSRRRLQSLFASVPWRGFHPSRLVFATLTYPAVFPANPRVWKSHLEAWRKRIEYRYGRMSMVWKMEFQRRGACHFHVLLFAPVGLVPTIKSEPQPWEFGEFLSESWHQIAGAGDLNHRIHGCDLRQAHSWRGAMYYLSKYIAKVESYKSDHSIGRVWGVWRRELLGVTWRAWNLEWVQYIKMRRVFRRKCSYRRGRGAHTGMTCFVEYYEFLRLLDWLGGLANPPPDRSSVLLRAERENLINVLAAIGHRVQDGS